MIFVPSRAKAMVSIVGPFARFALLNQGIVDCVTLVQFLDQIVNGLRALLHRRHRFLWALSCCPPCVMEMEQHDTILKVRCRLAIVGEDKPLQLIQFQA